MDYKHRYIEQDLRKPPPNFPVVLITGARRVGKSTLAKKLLEYWGGDSYFSFDTPEEIARFNRDPIFFLENLKTPAVLDEVQNVPQIFQYLKSRIDSERSTRCRFILTGSQHFEMMKHVSESLAGRIIIHDLYPFSFCETLGVPALNVESYLSDILRGNIHLRNEVPSREFPGMNFPHALLLRGGYPQTHEISTEGALVDWFGAYVQTYIQRDIRQLSAIQDLGQFDSFVRLIAGRNAHIVNYSELGKELGVNYKTARHYLSLLNASYIWMSLPPYFANTEKRLVKSPKGCMLDSGLACFLTGIFSVAALQSSPLLGHHFEAYVIAEFVKMLSAFSSHTRLYHFRSSTKAEVDLILEHDQMLIPIEIKCSATPQPSWGKGIHSFCEAFPKANVPYGIVISLHRKVAALSRKVWNVPLGIFAS